jgi:hypothetical protein
MIENKRMNLFNISKTILFTFVLLIIFVSTARAEWNASYIIADDKFIAQTMTEQQIQDFLNAQNSYLRNYVIPAPYSVDGYMTSNMVGPNDSVNATGWSVPHLIYSVQNWYGINAQVILTTLQKEQSLITNPNLNQYGINWAMGYAVPDSGNRNYGYAGIARQIDWGGYQFRYNLDKANSTDSTERNKVAPYFTGNTVTIDGVPTLMGTGATASLYRYTPHFHGNQNFRLIFINWFGNIDFRTSVYRFYTPMGTHFYTASESEKASIISKLSSYRFEGVAYQLNYDSGRNTLPLYRFYNMKNGTHFYTASEQEKNNVIAKYPTTYKLEGVAWYVSNVPYAAFPVYRFYNVKGTHFYTASEQEKNNVIAKYPTTYKFEGVAYYVPF